MRRDCRSCYRDQYKGTDWWYCTDGRVGPDLHCTDSKYFKPKRPRILDRDTSHLNYPKKEL